MLEPYSQCREYRIAYFGSRGPHLTDVIESHLDAGCHIAQHTDRGKIGVAALRGSDAARELQRRWATCITRSEELSPVDTSELRR